MRRLPPLLVAALALTPAWEAHAAESPAPATSAPARLFVELVVNGRNADEIIELRIAGASMIVDSAALRRANILIEGDGPVDVAATAGLRAHYDGALQRLELDAGPERLPVSRIAREGQSRVRTEASPGGLVNYDLYLMGGKSRLASLWTEQRAFGPWGLASNDGVLTASPAGNSGARYVRYDTYARFINENRALAFTAGDFIAQSLPWTRSVRMGGFQVSRAFRVRPDLITMPLPSFSGQAAVPSSVDLFVNGYRQQSNRVEPGRFVLDSVPVVTGAGQATIVTTDAMGRQIQTVVPFYVSADLLKPGLTSFSAEAGLMREGYGLASFDYGDAAVTGTIRHGVNPWLTVEGHFEASARHGGQGVGLALAPGRLGTVTASVSTSSAGGVRGARWSVGYEYASPRFNLAYHHEDRGADFLDLGDYGRSNSSRGRADRFVGAVNLGRHGALALAHLSRQADGGPDARIVTASYQRGLGRGASLLLSADHDLDRGQSGAQLRLAVPMGRNTFGASASRSQARTLAAVDYARATPSQGGLGVDAGLAVDVDGKAYGQATASLRTHAAEFRAGGAFANEQKSGWAGAAGSLVFMERGLFLAKPVNNAFALVSTGIGGVTVLYENQVVGTTDHHGRLFVPQVTSYQPAAFAIDTLSLSEDHVVAAVSTKRAVREGSGAVIRLPVRKAMSVVALLVDESGRAIEAGAGVTRMDGGETVVGWDGLVYLEDVGRTVELSVLRRRGGACKASVVIPDGVAPLSRIGPVQCV